MAATKLYFGFPRVTDSFTLSGGSWLATYPLPNLQTLRDGLSRVARSLDATTGSTVIIMTAAAPVSASVIALVGHNLSQSATIVVETWTDVAGTTGHISSGSMNVWPASYTAAELDGAVWTWFYRFADPGPSTVGMIKISITDTGNAAGYIQAGFLEIAGAADMTFNFAFGSQYGLGWNSQATRAIGGGVVVDPRPHPRIYKLNFDMTTRTNAMTTLYEMMRQLKMDQPVLCVPLPTETTHLLRTVMFGRLLDPGNATFRGRIASGAYAGLVDSVPLMLEEIVE